MFIKTKLGLGSVLLLALCLLSGEAIAKNISMYVGEVQILKVGKVDRVAVGLGKLLSTSLLKDGQLLLIAEGAGDTNVHIWYSSGKEEELSVTILEKNADRQIEELNALVGDLGNVHVRKVGERLFLTGSVPEENVERLKTVLAKYPEILDLTTKSPAQPVTLPGDKMVYMDVKITEFNITKLRQLGIDWSDAVAGPSAGVVYDATSNKLFRAAPDSTLAPSFAGDLPNRFAGPLGYFGIASEITSRINLLASNGDAVILAEPKLSARSGGKAEFLAGGEIPVVTTGTLGSSNVEYKEFGIKLMIEPLVDHLNNIVAKVGTEVSAVDRSNAVNNIPAFITRRTNTDISMRDGETLVMSGLIDRSIGKQINKIPFLGDIPILGRLFSSEDYNNNRTELVIFVTPTVFDAKSEFNKEKVDRRKQMFDKFKKDTGYNDLLLD